MGIDVALVVWLSLDQTQSTGRFENLSDGGYRGHWW
jgi:hypothetical protein